MSAGLIEIAEGESEPFIARTVMMPGGEILNLSPRTLNALINAGVGSIEQLTKCTESILSNFRGFGAKALDEVGETLAKRGLKLSEEPLDA